MAIAKGEQMKIVSIFNNKGGVGKTTYLYHIAHILENRGKKVLIVDLDSQCNVSAYSLSDQELEASWNMETGNSIWNAIERVYSGMGDIGDHKPSQFNRNYPNLYIVPGDIALSNYEDRLGDTWNSAKGGDEPALRVQSAIYRYILRCAQLVCADVVMLDLGPNLGSLNRAVISCSDYFIVPMAPDLFSIRGTENLGKKLLTWRQGWKQCNESWNDNNLSLPKGTPKFLGYVMQQHNIRRNADGMTKGWSIFGNRVANAVQVNIINKLHPVDQVHDWGDQNWNLGQIPNLHSLIPYSLEARKPVFDCSSGDGLTGAHIATAKDSKSLFDPIVDKIIQVI